MVSGWPGQFTVYIVPNWDGCDFCRRYLSSYGQLGVGGKVVHLHDRPGDPVVDSSLRYRCCPGYQSICMGEEEHRDGGEM